MTPFERWRLILGESASGSLGPGSPRCREYDQCLNWLYDREPGLKERGIRTREGGREGSQLTVPGWIDKVHQLFPRETIERLEQDAVERYGIDDLVTNPDVLQRVEPNQALLRAVLRTKHLMNPEILNLARELVRKVVAELVEKFAPEIRRSFTGTRDPRHLSNQKRARNFDFRTTLRKNLKHYDGRRVLIEKPYFNSRLRRNVQAWQIVLLVDQSGSMLDSVVHASITASCLWNLPGLKTHLVAFDTSVVDLTDHCSDPVETLLKVQLGGGTDIGRAVEYASALLTNPRRSAVVLISDFSEGGNPHRLTRKVAELISQGTKVLGLAALDSEAVPHYNRTMASRLVEQGAQVGAMTPGELASWIGEKMKE